VQRIVVSVQLCSLAPSLKAFEMHIDDDGYEKLSDDPKVVQCAELASKYKKDVQKLSVLSKMLKDAQPTSFVNLFDIMKYHGISDSSRVDSYASAQITKAVASFVGRGIYDELDSSASKKISSSKHVQHKIAACKFQHDVSTYITRATVDSATRGVDEHALMCIKEALLAQMFVVWSSVCVPLIETERKALQEDVVRCNSLLALVRKTVKSFSGIEIDDAEAEDAAYRLFVKKLCMTHHHTVERVRFDTWFVSSELIWKPAALCGVEAFVVWIRANGQLLRNALSQDIVRLQRLCKEPSDSSAWHGIEVVHTINDPIDAFRFHPPSYTGRFETPSGRVYAQYTKVPCDSITRGLTLVQTFWVLHDIIQRDWLPIRYVSANYALDLVESEIQLYSHTMNGIKRELTQVCRDAGYNIEEERIDQVVYEICSKYTDRSYTASDVPGASSSSSSRRSSASAAAPPTSSSCVDSCGSSSLLSTGSKGCRTMCIPTKPPNDTLCASRDKSTPFLPCMVHWHNIVDYMVIHCLSENVSDAIDRGRGRGIVSDIKIKNDDILAYVEAELLKMATCEECLEMRLIVEQLANKDSLRQCIPSIVKNLVHEGSKGCVAANESGNGQCVDWQAKYEPERLKKSMVLTVGYGTHDPMAFLFFNLCSRIKGCMDQSWPLPVGVEWKIKRHRVSSGAASAGAASPCP